MKREIKEMAVIVCENREIWQRILTNYLNENNKNWITYVNILPASKRNAVVRELDKF